MNEAAILILSIGVYFTIRSIIKNSNKRKKQY